jgi:hypothetical protein
MLALVVRKPAGVHGVYRLFDTWMLRLFMQRRAKGAHLRREMGCLSIFTG